MRALRTPQASTAVPLLLLPVVAPGLEVLEQLVEVHAVERLARDRGVAAVPQRLQVRVVVLAELLRAPADAEVRVPAEELERTLLVVLDLRARRDVEPLVQ